MEEPYGVALQGEQGNIYQLTEWLIITLTEVEVSCHLIVENTFPNKIFYSFAHRHKHKYNPFSKKKNNNK